MSGVGEGMGANQQKKRITHLRLKNGCIPDSQILSWQHIVCKQVTWRIIGKVGCAAHWVAQRSIVDLVLQHRLLGSIFAGRCHSSIGQRVLNQLLERAGDAVVVQWIGVLAASNHKHSIGFQITGFTFVIIDVSAT